MELFTTILRGRGQLLFEGEVDPKGQLNRTEEEMPDWDDTLEDHGQHHLRSLCCELQSP